MSKKAVPFNLVFEQRKRNRAALKDARTASESVHANAALKDLAASGWLIRALRYRIIRFVAVMLMGAAGACGGGGGKSDDDRVQRVVVKEADGERERARSPMDPVQGQHTGTTAGSPALTTNSAHTTNIINITNVGRFYATDGKVEIGSLNHDKGRKRRSTWRTGHSVSEAVVNDLNVGVGEYEARISDVGVQTEPEPAVQVADVGVQTKPEPAAQVADVGVQTDSEPVAQVADLGVQTDSEPAAQVADVGVQTDSEPVAQVADLGVQTEPEPAAQVADADVQTGLVEMHEAQGQYVGRVRDIYGFTALVTPAGRFYAIYTDGKDIGEADDIGDAVVGDLGNLGKGILYRKEQPAIKVTLTALPASGRSLTSIVGSTLVSTASNLVSTASKRRFSYQNTAEEVNDAYLNRRSIHLVASAEGLPPLDFNGSISTVLHTTPAVSKVAGTYKGMSSKRDYHVNETNMPSILDNMPGILEMTIDYQGRIKGTEGYCSFAGKIVPREWGNAYDIEIGFADNMMCSYQNLMVRGVAFYIKQEKRDRLRAIMQTSCKGGMLFNVTRVDANP
ncbi:hypothetical protein [Mycetohabitans sp. B3]|uniref:hypothetical protein n=1 Tax=Mycetohabitans sp. B3 TaxID=2841841 RepID=UPI001F470CC8|nr:hypothetical protein [Mycetohabitans sp. B3]MCF2134024.1 hypothetical protein [Mycetohabitans sp. B3]